ncbi:MAG: adenosylcobinamide-GDP ribazoletransferase [Gemmatimonadetes bacterium]|jgi:adenosylcobinamide-GDP ribazoletransferase|nr:adenosylcobinamide-GDP ribazoletransferase [Gemmatimonadota bacterium]
MRSFFEALRFLTAIPVPGLPHADERTIARSMAAFPLVGLVIGLLGALCGWLAWFLFGPPFHALAVVIAWTVLTLGLHLDGVADSCDALFSWRSRERKLEIMKDSRIGTMGALGLLTIFLAKIAALASLGSSWWLGALLAPLWGRWADIYGIFWFPSAREGGLGRTFHEQVRRYDFALATLISLFASAVLLFPWGGLLLVILLPLTHLTARKMVRSLGGLTGDTYGALSELAETIVLLALVATRRHFHLETDWQSLLALLEGWV